jgi:holo-[acyl-carrier protein] synthase
VIDGIGTDIISFDKIRRYCGKKYFLERIFTKRERDYTESKHDRLAHLAATFAAKEAVFKALGTGWRDPQNIEIIRNKSGKPEVRISGRLKRLMKNRKALVSLSYCSNFAVAFAAIKK